jgi:hypothetical protein
VATGAGGVKSHALRRWKSQECRRPDDHETQVFLAGFHVVGRRNRWTRLGGTHRPSRRVRRSSGVRGEGQVWWEHGRRLQLACPRAYPEIPPSPTPQRRPTPVQEIRQWSSSRARGSGSSGIGSCPSPIPHHLPQETPREPLDGLACCRPTPRTGARRRTRERTPSPEQSPDREAVQHPIERRSANPQPRNS